MIALVLAAVAAAASPIEAERAFAAAAVHDGQWTAFRAFAAPQAVLFNPQPVAASALLKDLADPARPILWSPTASYVACDGSLAANTGEWRRPDGSVGYFSTIWVRQRDGGWKWSIDGGDSLPIARAPTTEPILRTASCEHKPRGIVGTKAKGAKSDQGSARDATLFWSWVVRPDGARDFDVFLWSGDHYDHVIADRIAAPAGLTMAALFLSAFVTLFVVIDPLGCAPIFAGLTRGGGEAHRRTMALRSSAIATVILLLFALAGAPLLRALGISLDAFRAAGGIMLFLIALEMVFEKRTQRREHRVEEVTRRSHEGGHEAEDVSVFPMAIPMIAGPGSIATVMLLTSRNHGVALLIVLAALGAVMLLTAASLLAAGAIMRVLGDKLEAMITRILGVLLAALAAQFVIDGIKASFA